MSTLRRHGWLLAVLVAGCGGGGGAERPAATRAPAPSPTPITGTIDFSWSGTIVGREDRLRIEPDGRATLRSHGGAQRALDLPDRVVERIRDDVTRADLPDLDAHYGGPMVSDGSTQSITASGKTVVSDNGGGPPQLDAAIADLTDVVANADLLVRFRLGIRTTLGPDLAIVTVDRDGIATVFTPNGGGPQTETLGPADVRRLRAALDATPFDTRGAPGFADSRAPLAEDRVELTYRWLTLRDPGPPAKPAVRILRGLLPAVP
jgi:hypothetical protein